MLISGETSVKAVAQQIDVWDIAGTGKTVTITITSKDNSNVVKKVKVKIQ